MENSKEIPVYGYIRISPDEVAKGAIKTSFENQKSLILDTAPKLGMKVIELIYSKDKAGNFRNLSGSERADIFFLNMVARLKRKEAKGVLVKSRDRFLRDLSFFRDVMADLIDNGVFVYAIQERRMLDPYSVEDVMGAFQDEGYIIKGRKNAETLLLQKQGKGLPAIPAPYGYSYKTLHKGKPMQEKIWVKVPKKAEIVEKVFNLFVVEGMTPKKIKEELKIGNAMFYRILSCESYTGDVVFYKKRKDRMTGVVHREKVCYGGVHPAIINKALWEEAQKKIHRKKSPEELRSNFLEMFG